MSDMIQRVASMKQYCARIHWKLIRETRDGAVEPLFKITVPGPMGLRVVMAMDTADPRGASINELDLFLYSVRKMIDGNFDLLNCDECRDQSCERHDEHIELVDMADPNYDEIEKQYHADIQKQSIEAIVPRVT